MIYTATNKITNGDFGSSDISNWSADTGLTLSRSYTTVQSVEHYYLQLKTTSTFNNLDHAVDAYTTLSLTQPTDTVAHKFFVHLLSEQGFKRNISLHWTITYQGESPVPHSDTSLESYDGKHFYTIIEMQGANYTVTLTKIAVGLVQGESYTVSGVGAKVDDVIVVDLTAMFGAGNEPPSEWCAKRYTLSGSTVSIPQYVPPVENLTVDSVGTSSASISWDALSGADGYIINRTMKPTITDVEVSSASFYEDNLFMDTHYSYSVMAVMDGVRSDPTVSEEFVTGVVPKPSYSGENAHKLLRILQRHFRCICEPDRKVFLYFAGWMLNDPNVLLTDEAYNNFVSLFYAELDYLAKKNLSNLKDIADDPNYGSTQTLFFAAFKSIGITVTEWDNTYTFELPNGESKKIRGDYYADGQDHNMATIYVNSRLGATSDYWVNMRDVYLLTGEPIINFEDEITNICGDYTTWEFDEDTKTLVISGYGAVYGKDDQGPSYDGVTFWMKLGVFGDGVDTTILGAGVNNLGNRCFFGMTAPTFVCFQAEDFPVTLGEAWCGVSEKTAIAITIYTDNADIRAFDYASLNYNVTFKPISEWEGLS